jgi:hypothetical protein
VLTGPNELHDKVPSTIMRGILLLALLSIKSSYSREEETPLESDGFRLDHGQRRSPVSPETDPDEAVALG